VRRQKQVMGVDGKTRMAYGILSKKNIRCQNTYNSACYERTKAFAPTVKHVRKIKTANFMVGVMSEEVKEQCAKLKSRSTCINFLSTCVVSFL